jgi:hypothetical protein
MMEGFRRPEAITLPEGACVPSPNVIVPTPNQFTHELSRGQPFHFSAAQPGKPPDGELPAGTPVVLLRYDEGRYCHVADGRGLYVKIEHESLRPI